MSAKVLPARADETVDPELEFWQFRVEKITDPPFVLRQDFCLITLLCGGQVVDTVNGISRTLTGNVLHFLRPSDVHSYRRVDGDYPFLLLGFRLESFETMVEYVGGGLIAERYLEPYAPSYFNLSASEKLVIEERLARLGRTAAGSPGEARAMFRALLPGLFCHFLDAGRAAEVKMPLWLEKTCREMRKKANFAGGIRALRRVAHKSDSQLWRMFRRYLRQAPSDFINELRLDCAAELLAHTDKKIVVVAGECGLGNLSQFYKLFHRRFGTTPGRFRRAASKRLRG